MIRRLYILRQKNNCTNNVKLLLDLGINITDRAIIEALENPEYLTLFVKYGVDPNHIADLFIKETLKDKMATINFLSQNSVDFDQIIRNQKIDK